ncbi:outer dense fiber protein 2 isoform X2 [Oryzias latipes]|uniref:outer dense fiber protein 2 isoform X2 n=1 Tax=Oryzias latipes TaxID=8090 RepID=UPI0002A499D9|nr:outer dense fiber protein 2 isoform X2 [Oryzias latipes]
MSPEVEPLAPPVGLSSAGEDLTLSRGDLDSNHEAARTASRRLQAEAEPQTSCSDGKTSFLKLLIEAEAAANSAAVQLVSFRHAEEDGFVGPESSTRRRMARQRGLLLEKLEDFRQMNKSLRQKLKRLQATEAHRIDAEQQMDNLTKKMTQAESDNERLKKDLSEMEKRVEELMSLRREKQEEIKSVVQVTKSADAAQAHLQAQLRAKEAENRRLTSQLQILERTVVEQKLLINDLRASINSLGEKASKDREYLKKATRAQKRRAERFEAAVEKCYAQLKEKEEQLAKARTERDSRRQQKEKTTNEKDKLLAHVDLLKSEIADLTVRLQKAKNDQNAANETAKRKADKVTADNNDLLASNAALKACVARLEQQLADCEAALVEEKAVCQEKKLEAEQCQHQAAELQAELENLRLRYANLLRETHKTKHGTEAEVEKMESQAKQLRSSAEMTESVLLTNSHLQEKGQALQKQMDRLQQENLELVRRLAYQEEALSYSKGQLDQRSSECQTLNRQLEAALSDVRQQVNAVKTLAASREEALQTKILELEAEKSRRDNELRLLHQSKLASERQFQVRLKDLQLSLDQSESHKRSIQNYVDFLKNSYKTMFDEGLQATTFGSLHFLD